MQPASPFRSTSILPALPGEPPTPVPASTTLHTLKALSGKKRKQPNPGSPPSGAPKQIKSEHRSESSGASSTPVVTDRARYDKNPKRWMQVIIRNSAGLEPHQMTEKVRVLGVALGGWAMNAACREDLMTQILDAHGTYGEQQLASLLIGLGRALGGPTMSAEHRDTLSARILGAVGVCDNDEISKMVTGLGMALGGATMPKQHRSALATQILAADEPGNRRLTDLLFRGLGAALGSAAMTAECRDALLAQILCAGTVRSTANVGNMIFGLAVALGAEAISAENRNALMSQILAAHGTCSDDQICHLICGLTVALGGAAITAENRNALITQILAAHGRCSPQQVSDLVHGLRVALGGAAMSAKNRTALLLQILSAHRTCSSRQIGMMYSQLCIGPPAAQLLNEHLQAALSPIKTAMLAGATVSISFQIAAQKEQGRELLRKALTDLGMAQSHGSFVDAGVLAASGDLCGILAIESLSEGEKLNFIDFACGVVAPLDEQELRSQLGKIMVVDQSNKLRAQTLSTILTRGPFNPPLFALVRHWLIGSMTEIPNIQWLRTRVTTKEEVTVECDSAAFADWYGCIKELYHGVAKHMTAQCLEKEKIIVSSHPMLPSDVQKTILAVLDAQAAELTVTY